MGGDLTHPESLNPYAYALNNPTTLTDPLGLHPILAPAPTTCPPQCGPGDIAPSGSDIFDAIAGAPGTSFGTDMYGNVQWGWDTTSPFEYQFTGALYGQHVNTTFGTWAQYADWRTSAAALPQNQIYDAFWALLENNGLNPNTEFPVYAYQNGLTWNVRLPGIALNTDSAAQGRIPDPYHRIHDRSWYGLSPIDALHLAVSRQGAEAHFDWFNGVELFPLHEVFDYLPSLFINPKSQVPQPTVNWYCSGSRGCHQ